MAIADSNALLAEIMNAVDDHVTAKASRQLEKQIDAQCDKGRNMEVRPVLSRAAEGEC